MIPGDLLSAFPHRQFHTLPGLGLHYQTPTLTHVCLCREAVCTTFMMVFGMTWPRGELTTYRARGGHATDWANPTRSCMVDWLIVFNVPSTARSFRDGTPIYCPLRRTWSSINTPFRLGIEPRAVAWQSITLPLRYASSTTVLYTRTIPIYRYNTCKQGFWYLYTGTPMHENCFSCDYLITI